MRILIKIGGTLLDQETSRRRLASEITALARSGTQVVVVHGGGKQMTRFLAEKNVESHFVNGLRVTTPEVLDAVLKVLAGVVNSELVASFVTAGAMPVGLTGMDALLVEAQQFSEELGFVGRPVRCNAALIALLVDAGYLPVIACVAGNREGQYFNVNADQMAVVCAAAYSTDKLFFLTDVDGVRGPDDVILPVLTSSESRKLIANGVATGGMRAKLESASDALSQGVSEVVIARGSIERIVQQLAAGTACGTRLVREESGVYTR
jgi:acetylglutamate kinase